MDVNTKLNYTAITTNNLDATVTIAILDTIEEVQEYVFWKQSPIMTTIVYDLRSTIYDDSNSIMLILVNKVEQFEKLCINDVQTMFSILDFIIEILDLNCSHLYNYEYFHDYILHHINVISDKLEDISDNKLEFIDLIDEYLNKLDSFID